MPRSARPSARPPLYAVILAGGVGTRLWPRSRRRRPKQLLDMVDRHTMLQNTVERVEPLVPRERILVVTGVEYADQVRQQLPGIPPENVLAEPCGRGTGPSIGLAAVALSQRSSEAVMVSLHADHVIADAAGFRQLLAVAADMAAAGHLVTLGIQPSYPETGYGYIERGRLMRRVHGVPVFRVSRFVEKPAAERAAEFVRGRRHYWNSGLFSWRVDTILQAMQRWLPALHAQLERIAAAWSTPERDVVLSQVWGQVPAVSIDVGIMEQAEGIVVVPADIGWSDVGSWASLADILAADDEGNVILGESDLVCLDTRDSLVYAPGRTVAAIGLRDLVVVDTGDVLFLCPKDRAQDVRLLVDRLRACGREHLL